MNIDWGSLTASSANGWDLLFAALSIAAAWILSIFARKGVLAVLRRTPGVPEGVALFAARFTKYAIILLGIGVGLGFLGASIQPLLAITLILAVVLVLVLRGVADNFAAGVLIQTRRPVKVGDEIESGGYTGTVTELNARAVVIHTVDGRTVHIPNAMVLQEPIINHSDRGARRSEVQVRVSRADAEPDEVLSWLTDAAAGAEGVHKRESTRAVAIGLSPSRFTVTVQFWHHPLHAVPVASAVVVALAEALAAHSLTGTVTSDPGDPPLTVPDTV